jgi:hypothetical protein
MKYENLFKIHIPEPCHEDWDKMTPNTKGAFCNSCAKTVVDFSGKSDEEVQKYLFENIDKKICGRFLPSQLDEEPVDEPKLKIALEPQAAKWNFPTYLMPIITPFRVAAMSMMLFASLALSSCGNSNEAGGEDDGRTVGIMVVVPDSTQTQDTTNSDVNNNIKGNVNLRVQGGLSIDRVRDQDKNNQKSSDSTCVKLEHDTKTFGKIMVTPKTDTVKVDSSETRMIKGEIAPQKDPPIKMGMIKKKDK